MAIVPNINTEVEVVHGNESPSVINHGLIHWQNAILSWNYHNHIDDDKHR